ncbi:MAG: asparaginase [Chloroflexi bacterium]|nr:asparaginase [Chloroflexota bacterium]
MTVPASPARRSTAKPVRAAARPGRGRAVPPILVRQVRNGIEESVHRGDIVEVDAAGRLIRQLGDADRAVTLRSTVKPFGLLALIEAGGIEAFDLEPAEIAILASSHSGEDLHVRTLQGIYRRTGVSQSSLACGSEGMPLDALTASRLARDGEKAGPVRHMCSGQHTVSLLLSRLRGWDPAEYWKPGHPSQIAYRAAVAAVFDTPSASLRTAVDGCGIETFAFPLREVARAFAMLADPSAIPANDRRAELARSLTTVRDAMLANPELIGGRHDRLDTSMMKAAPGRLISKSGMEALRGVAILPGPRIGTQSTAASGLAIKIEDGDGYDRGTWAASVEAVRQVGALDGGALRDLARYHRPVSLDPHGRAAAEAVPEFELVPVGELIG